ncbi:hypothetical protein Tco_1361380 [Tanacetum coccineum]
MAYRIFRIRPNSYKASHINNSIPQKEKDPGSFTLPCYINNVCFNNALADLGASISVMPLSTYLNLGLGELAHTKLTVELADRTMKYPNRIAENVLVGVGKFVFPVDFIILDMPKDVKVSLILGRPFLSTPYAKIDVFKRKITLRVGDEKIIFKSMKHASSLINRVYMLGLRERMELHLEVRLMGETFVLNRSLDPLYRDYIKLNDLNVPLELSRDQVDDLMPTIEEGEWKIWMATEIKTWEISSLENHSAKLRKKDLAGKEIDKVGEVSIIWNPMSFGNHLEEKHVTWAQFGKKQDKNATLQDFDQAMVYSAWRRRPDFLLRRKSFKATKSQTFVMTSSLRAEAKRLFGSEKVWFEMPRCIAWDKVDNSSPQSTPQVLLSFDVYTSPVTYPKEVEETIGIPIEVILDEESSEALRIFTWTILG